MTGSDANSRMSLHPARADGHSTKRQCGNSWAAGTVSDLKGRCCYASADSSDDVERPIEFCVVDDVVDSAFIDESVASASE